MLLLQLLLYCLLFLLLVKCAVRDNGRNCLYFYPKGYLDEAQRRGLIDRDAVMKKGKRFMVPFCIVMLLALIAILAVWNRVTEFRAAYWQAAVLLIGMNWFDGIVLDRLWVGHGKIWRVAGMEGVPYVKPWKDVLIKRSAATVIYLILAAAAAGGAVLLGKLL